MFFGDSYRRIRPTLLVAQKKVILLVTRRGNHGKVRARTPNRCGGEKYHQIVFYCVLKLSDMTKHNTIDK